MDGLFTLLSLSLVMAGASFLAGTLPLALKLSRSKLRLISTVGMGVLVGTSLIVIIPEGIDTLYSSSHNVHSHRKRDTQGFARHTVAWQHREPLPQPLSLGRRTTFAEPHDILDDASLGSVGPVIPDSIDNSPPKTPTKPGEIGILEENEADEEKHGETSEGHSESHHAWIGVALITGFMLMFLIDKVPQYTTTSKPKAKTHHIALNNLGRRFNMTTSIDREEESENFLESSQSPKSHNQSFATTTGLVIHAAADGIALGASSSTSQTGLSLVIFFAIMVHKAPAAFGLTSILLQQGLSKRMARAHLVMFSLAAPAGAILTWILVHLLGGGASKSMESSQWWTGMLLLFSAGTFLYVAMHSMQDITSPKHEEQQSNGHAIGGVDGREVPNADTKPSLIDLAAACFGMILPLFLQVGHAH